MAKSLTRNRRFTDAEQQAFGRWAHVKTLARIAGEVPQQNLADKADLTSAPLLECIPQSSEASTAASTPRGACSKATTEQTQVYAALDRLLPVKDFVTTQAEPATSTACSSSRLYPEEPSAPSKWNLLRTSTRRKLTRNVSKTKGQTALDREEMLEQIRRQLLQRFRSLHDAFARLDSGVARDQALAPQEFCRTLATLGLAETESYEVFLAMDSRQKGSVSLIEFLHALVDGSPDAFLWELRCRLLSAGIGPNSMHRVLELARMPRHRGKARVHRMLAEHFMDYGDHSDAETRKHGNDMGQAEPEADECGPSRHAWREASAVGDPAAENQSRPMPSRGLRLGRTEWLRLCAALGLTLLEAERLFYVLGGDDSGAVGLKDMFGKLRATVAPDVSLERFAVRVLRQYGSFESAFDMVRSRGPHSMMGWPEFHALAASLDVNNSNAFDLWNTLSTSLQHRQNGSIVKVGAESEETKEDADAPQISEEMFVQELSVWAPDTELDALKIELCEQFGNLNEWRRMLTRNGTACHLTLSPASLCALLNRVGIVGYDAEHILFAASGAEHGQVARMTLDGLIEVMENGGHPHRTAAHSTIRGDIQPVWERLQSVKSDLRIGARCKSRHDTPISPRKPVVSSAARARAALSAVRPNSRTATSRNGMHNSTRSSVNPTLASSCPCLPGRGSAGTMGGSAEKRPGDGSSHNNGHSRAKTRSASASARQLGTKTRPCMHGVRAASSAGPVLRAIKV